MNILGFVSAILIIFSIICATMLHQHVDDEQIKKSIQGYYLVNEEAENMEEKNFFTKIKANKEEKTKASPTVPPQSTIIDVKDDILKPKIEEKEEDEDEDEDEDENIVDSEKPNKTIYGCSTLNIFSLLNKGKENDPFSYEIFAKIIRELYGKELSKKNMEYFLIDSLIKKSQQIIADKEELFLEKISFDDEELQGLWYKMLKGSKFYDFEKKVGYPSIFEFISYYESKKETICMQKVSYQMLVCLFNEKIASDIKENQKIKSKKAKRKVTYLARKDLDDILSNNKFEQKNFNMLEHLTFSTHKNHKNTSSLIICKDLKTKISIKKKN